MSDQAATDIPSGALHAVWVAIYAAVRELWGWFVKMREAAKNSARIAVLEDQVAEWQERWAKEVKLGASRAMIDTSKGPPESLPEPEWEERTAVRNLRQRLERERLDEELRKYSESTPPRPRQKSRPDR